MRAQFLTFFIVEVTVANLHNMAFAEWFTTLEPCYRNIPVTPEMVLAWTQLLTHAVWLAYANGHAAGYANCETRMEAGRQKAYKNIS